MKIIQGLEQGSVAWLQFRRSHVMATDVSALIGVNPWSTPTDIYNEKFQLVPPKQVNDRMRRGQLLEQEARDLFNEKGFAMSPCVVESDIIYWAAASLDGISRKHDLLLEIKCPNDILHFMALDEKKITDYYNAQIQWQLYVTKCDLCMYVSYSPNHVESMAIVEIKADYNYMETLVDYARDFYENHMLTITPPADEWKLK